MGWIYPLELKLNQENQNDDKATFLDLEEQIIDYYRHMTKQLHSSLKVLITLTFLVISQTSIWGFQIPSHSICFDQKG